MFNGAKNISTQSLGFVTFFGIMLSADDIKIFIKGEQWELLEVVINVTWTHIESI